MTIRFNLGRRTVVAYATLRGWGKGSRFIHATSPGTHVWNAFPFGVVIINGRRAR